MATVKAAFLTEKAKLCEGVTDIDSPAPDEVTVDIAYCGICGSDVHFFEHGRIGKTEVPYPFILGHECAGIVSAVGDKVNDFVIGDRVTLEPGVPCGNCEFCRQGRYNLCPDVRFLAAPPTNGAFREKMNFPARMVYRLPDEISLLEGALIEPLAVGMQAVDTAGVRAGKSVAILGGGAIGLMTLMACRAAGASLIVVSDLFEKRLLAAEKVGATHGFNAGTAADFMEMTKWTGGEGFDYVFETAGTPVTASQTSHLVRRGGTITMVGNIVPDVSFSFRNLYLKEATVRAIFRYHDQYPAAIERVRAGVIPVKKVVSDIVPLNQIQEAFERAVNDKEHVIKTVVQIVP